MQSKYLALVVIVLVSEVEAAALMAVAAVEEMFHYTSLSIIVFYGLS